MDGTFDKMTMALKQSGLVAAVKVLNQHVRQRYSAVYRLAPDKSFVNLALVDKQGDEPPPFLLSVPFESSFCQFTLKFGAFQTPNSALDDRLDGHPYKGVMNSYYAAPLISADGKMKGTICHFDTEPMTLPDEDFELMRLTARVLSTFLRI